MKHTTIDCYGSNQHQLDDMKVINQVLTDVTYQLNLNPICPPAIIPYYYGKVKEDIGISAFVLLEGGHITIHTFPIRECYFVDVFYASDFDEKAVYDFFLEELPFSEKKSIVNTRNRELRAFNVFPYDPLQDFGPHVMVEINTKDEVITMEKMFDFLENMAYEINMDPISRPFVLKSTINDPLFMSGLIVIAQSHISLHYDYNSKMIFGDIFSCAPFDYTILSDYFKQLGDVVSSELVARGTKHIYKVKSNVTNAELIANTKWQHVIKKK